MSILDALILGIVQGLTEFLPVSSSGHLVLAQEFLGWTGPNLAFDVSLHFATILAVIIYFRQRLLKMDRRLAGLLIVGTIPAGLVGILFKDLIEGLFASPLLVSGALVVTGLLDLHANSLLKPTEQGKQLSELTVKDLVIVGVCQAVAITPGISRSGSTVWGGLVRKIDRQAAFTLSFLLSIPAVLGAALLELIDIVQTGGDGVTLLPFIAGGVTAFVIGFASLKLLEYVVTTAKLNWFGWYCLAAGVISGAVIWL